MVNVDLTKVLPTRAYEYFTPFFPGLFFVLSVVVADPDLAVRLAANSQRGLMLGRYGTVGMALFFAFVIGCGFMLVDTFIQYLMGHLYRVKLFLYRRICDWPLRQVTGWLLTKPRWRRAWLSNFHVRVMQVAAVGFDDWRKFQSCWGVFVRRLLKVRFGIDPQDLHDDDWQVL
jgi:hypothetical protein